jgi:tetratricopeptide (TPR) repeat protein
MNIQIHLFKRVAISIILLLLSFTFNPQTNASSLLEKTRQLDIGKIGSLTDMKAAIESLNKSMTDAINVDMLTFELQRLVLMKSGECISKLASFLKSNGHNEETFKQEKKNLFLTNRDLIKRIMDRNKRIIRDFQENLLDRMEDPLAFFESIEWQHPQYLVSLSNYWLSWNSYYCSLLLSEKDPIKKKLLEEAISGFSSASIDFKEKTIIAKSLFGRGLSYKQNKAYENALIDFKSVRRKVSKDELLHLRCRYEEALMCYQTGNSKMALRGLNEIQEDFHEEEIPEEILNGIEKLRARTLIALLEQKGKEIEKHGKAIDKDFLSVFSEMKQLAATHKGVDSELYWYAKGHADNLKCLSYTELGPIATIAIGDSFFEKKDYDSALHYYMILYSNSPDVLKDRMDKVWFRIGYIYCKKSQWSEAVSILGGFSRKFSRSHLIKQAASLYYVAASHNHAEESTKETYARLIDSIQYYLNQCDNCPDQSEAHFQLGKYYQEAGNGDKAVTEFLQVGKDSPNYALAKHNVLHSYLEQLESLAINGKDQSKIALKTYKDANRLLKEYRHVRNNQEAKAKQKNLMEPQMIILEARLHLFGQGDACRKSLQKLKGFESRFPREERLFVRAISLRAIYYHRLGMQEKAHEEIIKLLNVSTADSERYAVMHDLANRYYSEAKSAPLKADTALMIYEKLYTILQANPLYEKYCNTIQQRVAEIYMNKGESEKAIELYQDLIRKDPQSGDAVYNIGLLYEKTGKWKDALSTWRRFSDGVKGGTYHWFESRYRTANAFNMLGKRDKACEILNMTLVLHPDLGNKELEEKFLGLKSQICEGNQ